MKSPPVYNVAPVKSECLSLRFDDLDRNNTALSQYFEKFIDDNTCFDLIKGNIFDFSKNTCKRTKKYEICFSQLLDTNSQGFSLKLLLGICMQMS